MRSIAKQNRSQESRHAVITAAIEIGSQQGYDRTRTREIAQAAYISEGGMFRHFHSKADLFADAFEVAAEALTDQYAEPMAAARARDDIESLDALIRSLLSDPRMRLVVDVLSATQFDEQLAEHMRPALERLESRLVDAAYAATHDVGQAGEELRLLIRQSFEQLIGRVMLQRALGREVAEDDVIRDVAAKLSSISR